MGLVHMQTDRCTLYHALRQTSNHFLLQRADPRTGGEVPTYESFQISELWKTSDNATNSSDL